MNVGAGSTALLGPSKSGPKGAQHTNNKNQIVLYRPRKFTNSIYYLLRTVDDTRGREPYFLPQASVVNVTSIPSLKFLSATSKRTVNVSPVCSVWQLNIMYSLH